MKMASLFNIITDSRDVLDFFEGVDSPEQLVTRLDRLKRQGAPELLACIDGLRASVTEALDDTLEMNASLDDDTNDALDIDEELANLARSEDEEKQISTATPPAEEAKNVAAADK